MANSKLRQENEDLRRQLVALQAVKGPIREVTYIDNGWERVGRMACAYFALNSKEDLEMFFTGANRPQEVNPVPQEVRQYTVAGMPQDFGRAFNLQWNVGGAVIGAGIEQR